MFISKTDFILFLQCPKALWLLKHKPDQYPYQEFTLFMQKLIKDGYEVEEYAQKLFPTGVVVPNTKEMKKDAEQTKEMLQDNVVLFQPTFLTDEGLLARVDILRRNEDGTYSMYEVKSSTSVKTDKKHNQIYDACFQKYVLEQCGLSVSKVYIIHLDKLYVLKEEVEPEKMLQTTDVTEKVAEEMLYIQTQIGSVIELLHEKEIDESVCSCVEKTKANHCDAFTFFNGEFGKDSIYHLRHIREEKIQDLLDIGVKQIQDIPEHIELNDYQQIQKKISIY